MKRIAFALRALLLLWPLGDVINAGQQADAPKDIYLREKGSPLVPIFPVTGSAVVLKNVGQKTIASYTFACFQRRRRKPKIDVVFEQPERDSVPPNETTGEYRMDATPPNRCRSRRALLGVYQVEFNDGTSWETTASR
ncbi:MAG TPA: hypothetical protein VIW67_04495 [Terriglobales bacterium]